MNTKFLYLFKCNIQLAKYSFKTKANINQSENNIKTRNENVQETEITNMNHDFFSERFNFLKII